MTAHIPDTDAGRAADAEAALSAAPTAPVVAALPGNDQPREKWQRRSTGITTENGRVLFNFCTSTLSEEAMAAAAPDMYALIADIEESLTADNSYRLLREACRDILAKARGQ